MNPLTFCAQLSLDFIFGNVKELPKPGEEVLASYFDIQLGGGTLAYPIILTRLGIDCRVILKKASSIHGDLAFELLKKAGIKELQVQNANGFDPVMSTAVISQATDRCFVSCNNSRAFEFEDEFLLEALKGSKVIFAMENNPGILPELKRGGSTVVLDVGWSEDLSLARYEQLLSHVDFFTPNDKEAMKMTGTSSVEDSLRILGKHVSHPIVSCGGDGCATIFNDEIVTVPNPKGIKVIDTTGAGDNFMAGLIYGICQGMDVLDCMRFANCTGALSTTRPGCYGAAYTLDDVMKLFNQ